MITYSRLGYDDITEALLQSGADPNIPDKSGKTPLYVSCSTKHDNVVRLLLRHDTTDVNLPDRRGQTPLLTAVIFGSDSIILQLLRKGANPNIMDNSCNSCVLVAAQRDDLTILEILLQSGANPDVCDGEGVTLLHHAVQNQSDRLVKLVYQVRLLPLELNLSLIFRFLFCEYDSVNFLASGYTYELSFSIYLYNICLELFCSLERMRMYLMSHQYCFLIFILQFRLERTHLRRIWLVERRSIWRKV